MLIVAFVLSAVFITGGLIGTYRSTGFDDIAWLVIAIWPGVAGLVLALLSLGVKWIPVIKVVSPYLAWISCIATLSMVGYMFGSYLLDLVWKR